MSLNDYMHPRNVYKNNPPKFEDLASLFSDFKKLVQYSKSGKPFVNFRNPDVVRTLCICLLDKDFQLKLELPPDRLAPTVPLRLNYLLWLEDLLGCAPGSSDVTILDIGCGSSCVYPLLGCRLVKSWKFVATEIDDKNLMFARRNVQNNELCDRINVVHATNDGALLDHNFDACMCNPPFFTSDEELLSAADRPVANSSCSGDRCELVGGDYLFAKRIFQESLLLKSDKLWFTVMLGKKSSVIKIKDLLRHEKVKSVCWTEFCQGRTMRWGVAWSFKKIDSSSVVKSQRKKKRKNTVLTFTSKYCLTNETVEATKLLLHSLGLEFTQNNSTFILNGNIELALPNRKRRRKAKQAEDFINGSLSKNQSPISCLQYELKIVHVPAASPNVELRPLNEGFPDLLNRLYVHLRQKL